MNAPIEAKNAPPLQEARERLRRMVQDGELPGAQYVVVGAERALLDAHVGVVDVAAPEPMESATLQLAYSVTKSVTAVAVMQLVDAGAMHVDAPLSAYWPEHPYGPEVTIRALLAHTAGIPSPMPLRWFTPAGEPLDRDARLREVLRRQPRLVRPVGERYAYTNLGYWLLEKAIEAASGEDYGRYVGAHVFEPLGVSRDAFTFDVGPERSAATGHAPRFTPMGWMLRALTPARYWASPHARWRRSARLRSHGRAYGGLWCSAGALAPLLQDLLRAQPTLISASARELMLAEQSTREGARTGAALGWVVGELHGVPYFGKQGGGLGFSGNLRLYPTLGLGSVLLCNRTEIAERPIDARSDALDAAFVRPT